MSARYAALVATLPPNEQAWEQVLQDNLGSFYYREHPIVDVRRSASRFLPPLPLGEAGRRPGEGASGGASKAPSPRPSPRGRGRKCVRLRMVSKSPGPATGERKESTNVNNIMLGVVPPAPQAGQGGGPQQRLGLRERWAPANCGPTASGIKNIDAWLASAPGGEKWDVIHFNFGIHDRNTPVADYAARLEQLVERMKKTGAKLMWASTTPIPDNPAAKQSAASVIERNAAAATIMKKHGVAIDDLFAFITPHLADVQPPNDVHYTGQGYEMLGRQVAEAIAAILPRAPASAAGTTR